MKIKIYFIQHIKLVSKTFQKKKFISSNLIGKKIKIIKLDVIIGIWT
jgi:hypothetical protein